MELLGHTSEGTFDDLEVGDVVEEIGGTGSIGVPLMGDAIVAVETIGMAIDTVGVAIDTVGSMAVDAVGGVDWITHGGGKERSSHSKKRCMYI